MPFPNVQLITQMAPIPYLSPTVKFRLSSSPYDPLHFSAIGFLWMASNIILFKDIFVVDKLLMAKKLIKVYTFLTSNVCS
ncbi:hypothetical protein ISN44_As09g007820 [Arabidopsis suecica]|uniref:Uncharacterized protein n=1 Tax=Arabidopsis suecica TaxID=45249 RepID=A0A8T2AI11_ARASU|nr:hypothetical protein ISN44_As09g007820 [Arabidopsis suecica]